MNIEEINGAIKEIADTFKIRNQQLKLIEELGELTREISKNIANGRNLGKIPKNPLSPGGIWIII